MNKLDAFNWMVLNAYSISLMTFVGQNYGAGLSDRARASLRDCMALGMITTSLISVAVHDDLPLLLRPVR